MIGCGSIGRSANTKTEGRSHFVELEGDKLFLVTLDAAQRVVSIAVLDPRLRMPDEYVTGGSAEPSIDVDPENDTLAIRLVDLPGTNRKFVVWGGFLKFMLREDGTFVGVQVLEASKHLDPEFLGGQR